MANQRSKRPRERPNKTPTHSQANGVQVNSQASPAPRPSASMPTMSPETATVEE